MWYNQGYENTHFYPPPDRRGTAADPGRVAFVRCLCLAPLPDRTSQRPRRTSQRHCKTTGLRRPDGAQCHPWLQCLGSGSAESRLLAPPSTPYQLFGAGPKAPQRSAASQPPRFWERAQHLDLGTGSPGQLRARDHLGAHLRRKHAPCPQTPENQLEARQTLD